MHSKRSKGVALALVGVLFVGFGFLTAEAADYFPLEVGNRWIYSPSYGDKGDRIDTIIGEETVNDVHTYIWNRQEAPDDNYNEKLWLAKDGTDLKLYRIWSNEGLDPATTLGPPWIGVKLNPSVGDTWVVEGNIGAIHAKITRYIESINETVSVPAGTFNNCIRVRELNEITENSITEYEYEKHWFAPDVGPIIYRDYTTNWDSVKFSQELVSFSVTIRGLPGDVNDDGRIGLEEAIHALQVVSGIRQVGWQCQDDDEASGIYRICNYWPLNPGNQWIYTTGDRFIVNEIRTCSSGYSGIRYGTTAYEYEPFMQNGEYGFLWPGCEYERPEGDLIDIGTSLVLIAHEMHIGESTTVEVPGEGSIVTTLIGHETVTVPARAFTALKIEMRVQHTDGSCSYKTTLWLAKGIGPVKIHRTDADSWNCLGCIFVCDPDNDVTKLNTPAELISAVVDGRIH